ncbi:MAG: zf-TFIIB domain-containing protein, partial [Caedimonadaceae bacterium]
CEGIWLDAGEMEAIGEMEKGAMKRMFSLFKA